ncbi:hypothetical protein OROGR_006195 [Orobanche gracilis]
MGGFRFTYYQQVGAKLSKLDRVLVCSSFMGRFPLASCCALVRTHSDHNPILINLAAQDFGPSPFKLFNSWLLRDDFEVIVTKACLEFKGFGAPDSYFSNKLKLIKRAIRNWRAVEFPKESAELKNLKDSRLAINIKIDSGAATSDDLLARDQVVRRIDELDKITLADLKQKSRVKWLVDGDENSRFFHGFVANRSRRNHIHGFLVNGVWVSAPTSLKDETAKFFEEKFIERWPCRPPLRCPNPSRISNSCRDFLESGISVVEIKNAVWACGGEKAPGPDGFSFKFLKRFWSLLKDDITAFVRFFEQSGSFSRGCNSSFISLIAKVKGPLALGDFRPISLISSLYKIFAKISCPVKIGDW